MRPTGIRRTYVLECDQIAVELVDGDRVIAESQPDAQWLPGDVLAVRRTVKTSHGEIAPAVQAMLDRQDLVTQLRLVLRDLAGHDKPTQEQIKTSLELVEIDAQAFGGCLSQLGGPHQPHSRPHPPGAGAAWDSRQWP